jgi:hypothetical protein
VELDSLGPGVTFVQAVCDNCAFLSFAFSDRGPLGGRSDVPYQFSRFYKEELSALARLFPDGIPQAKAQKEEDQVKA